MKIKKRNKLFSLCLVLVLMACVTAGGVLAMQATESNADNNLMITQTSTESQNTVQVVSKQRGTDGNGETALVSYRNNTILYPLVGSAEYDGTNFDQYGMPTAAGYVDQIVTLRNESSKTAYARLLVAIPAALEAVDGDANKKALHWNVGNRFLPNGNFGKGEGKTEMNESYSNYELTSHMSTKENPQMVNGQPCNIYVFTYSEPLTGGEETQAAAFVGFYLDKDVNVKDNKVYLDGRFTGYEGTTVDIAVKAQAVYTDSPEETQDDLMAALNAKSINPWATVNH